ncbi:MAG: response regulator, partial [Planctomycetota bacterium]
FKFAQLYPRLEGIAETKRRRTEIHLLTTFDGVFLCEHAWKKGSEDEMNLLEQIKSRNILVVDDNQTNCEILQNQLSIWGFESSVCNDSTVVVNQMKIAQKMNRGFDLVVLDFCMPSMNGSDVAREISLEPSLRDTPIILLSSNHELMSHQEAQAIGIGCVMTKPARQSRLFDALVNLLARDSRVVHSQTAAAGETNVPPSQTPNFADQQVVATSPPSTTPTSVLSGPVTQTADDFPVAPAESQLAAEAQPATETRPAGEASQTGTEVLIAEDNPVNQMVVSQMLSSLGYSSAIAANGQVAVQRIQSGPPVAMVLMDGHMPVMDGLEATRAIRKWEQDSSADAAVPIVALTANVVRGIRQECKDAGMNDYMQKPITLKQLKNVVEKYAGPAVQLDQGIVAADADNAADVGNAADADIAADVDNAATTSDLPPFDVAGNVNHRGANQQPAASENRTSSVVLQPANPSDPQDILIDLESLHQKCGGDTVFQRQLLSIMRDAMPSRIDELANAVSVQDQSTVRNISHQLQGAAADSGLNAIAAAAKVLQTSAIEGNSERIRDGLQILEQRVEVTMNALQQILKEDYNGNNQEVLSHDSH